jgi:hypothetical protein
MARLAAVSWRMRRPAEAPVVEGQAEPAQPGNEPTIFTVVAQLRGAFATRFLLAARQHLSRIGVDFIDP